MTNAEKFKEVFGFDVDLDSCLINKDNIKSCNNCPLDKYSNIIENIDCTHGYWKSDYVNTEI